MKKSITGAVALLAGAFVAHSQGTVSFASYLSSSTTGYSLLTLNGTPVGGTSTTTTGTPLGDIANGGDWTVALYANTGPGDAASTLTQTVIDGSGSPGTPVTSTLAGGGTGAGYVGTWFSSAIADIPGQPTTGGTPATVQLYAWYNDGGTIATYNAAVAAGVPAGFSKTATVASTGGPQVGAPNATAPTLPFGSLGNVAMTATSTIPEPSTIALGVMGASAFLLRLRKKQ